MAAIALRRAVVLHGYRANPSSHWFDWLGEELAEHGIETLVPAMPNSAEPEPGPWLNAAIGAIGEPGEDLVIIAHSLGAITALRALDAFAGDWRLGALAAVAGCQSTPAELPVLGGFFADPPDIPRTVARTARRVSFRSDDDAIVLPQESTALARALDAEEIVVPGGEHFLGVQGWTRFPQLKEWVLDG